MNRGELSVWDAVSSPCGTGTPGLPRSRPKAQPDLCALLQHGQRTPRAESHLRDCVAGGPHVWVCDPKIIWLNPPVFPVLLTCLLAVESTDLLHKHLPVCVNPRPARGLLRGVRVLFAGHHKGTAQTSVWSVWLLRILEGF